MTIFATLVLTVMTVAADAQKPGETKATPPQTARPAAPAPKTPAPAAKAAVPVPPPTVPAGVTPPPGYLIGPDDVLAIVFWKDKDMSTDAVVRPDGQISLPLLRDVQAAGLTPEQLATSLAEDAKKYLEDPNVTVVVKTINSRKVFVTGAVGKVGAYPLTSPTTVMQLISMAGGLSDFADVKNIVILRTENGKQTTFKFNYKDVVSRKNLTQNIELRPGDTVIVP